MPPVTTTPQDGLINKDSVYFLCFCCKKKLLECKIAKYPLCDECEKDKIYKEQSSQILFLKELNRRTSTYRAEDEKYGELKFSMEGLLIDMLERIETLENELKRVQNKTNKW